MSRRSNNIHILFHKKTLDWSCKYNTTTSIVKKWQRASIYTLIWCSGICNTDTRPKIIHEFMWVIFLLIHMFYKLLLFFVSNYIKVLENGIYLLCTLLQCTVTYSRATLFGNFLIAHSPVEFLLLYCNPFAMSYYLWPHFV